MQKEARSQKPEARRTRCKLSVAILASGLWLLASFCLHAEIIDRIVAIVEGRIITTSDIRREREVRGILGEKPVDDKPLINELIENDLIENQMADFPGVEVPDLEIEAELKQCGRRSESAFKWRNISMYVFGSFSVHRMKRSGNITMKSLCLKPDRANLTPYPLSSRSRTLFGKISLRKNWITR